MLFYGFRHKNKRYKKGNLPHTRPKSMWRFFMDYFHAFWVGGLICALAQILLERTKMLPGRIMVLLVCIGAVLSFIGLYGPLAEFAGAGVTVPLMGFGHNLMKGVREAVDENGFIGLFMGGFKAAAVGTGAALIFGYLASLIFQPKMKK